MKDLIYLTTDGVKTTLAQAKATNKPYEVTTVDNTDHKAIVSPKRAALVKEKGVLFVPKEHGKYVTDNGDVANTNNN